MPSTPGKAPARPARAPGVLAWQGWTVRLPGGASPVKIEGDFAAGYVLLADLRRPRIGLRWKRIGKRSDPAKAVHSAMVREVGQLAADDAKPFDAGDGLTHGLLYEDDDPVQRDVWVGFSPATRRVVQLTFPIQRRERPAVRAMLRSAADQDPSAGPMLWSVFELQCQVPAGLEMVRQRLHSGDLGLNFAGKRLALAVRQVAPASVALTRLKIDRWLANQETRLTRHYRAVGEPQAVEIPSPQGVLTGVSRNLSLRKRYLWVWWMARRWQTVCLHDEARDRLTIVQATDPAVVAEVAASVGHAAGRAWTDGRDHPTGEDT